MSFGSTTITVPLKDILWAYGSTPEEAEDFLAIGLLEHNLLGVESLGIETAYDWQRDLYFASIKAIRWAYVEKALAE